MRKINLSVSVMLLVAGSTSFAQDNPRQPAIVWSGPANSPTYQAMSKNGSGVVVRQGKKSLATDVEVRAGVTGKYIEVKNQRSNAWVGIAVSDRPTSSEASVILQKAFQISNCDLVKTILNLTESTPEATVHFNSKPVGDVKSDGRFYYESDGVCRQSKVELVATHKNCKDFSDSFTANDNPHTYTGKAALECPPPPASTTPKKKKNQANRS